MYDTLMHLELNDNAVVAHICILDNIIYHYNILYGDDIV